MKEYGPVLVTGAGSGIGRAITETLTRDGHLVYATARKDADLKALDRIPNVEAIKLDVTNSTDVKKAAETVMERGRGLYGLVNNAGTAYGWPVAECTDEDLHEVFEVNVIGVHRVTRAMLPFLARSNGRIVNIGSVYGFGVTQFLGAYQMSKHALEAYSDSLALNLGKHGILVTIIEPGSYMSAIDATSNNGTRKRALSRTPILMKREIARYVRQLDRGIDDDKRAPPEGVAKVVADALFSKTPKHRYVPTPVKEEFFWAIESIAVRLIQANAGNERALDRKQMHAFLDEIWDKEVKKS